MAARPTVTITKPKACAEPPSVHINARIGDSVQETLVATVASIRHMGIVLEELRAGLERAQARVEAEGA